MEYLSHWGISISHLALTHAFVVVFLSNNLRFVEEGLKFDESFNRSYLIILYRTPAKIQKYVCEAYGVRFCFSLHCAGSNSIFRINGLKGLDCKK